MELSLDTKSKLDQHQLNALKMLLCGFIKAIIKFNYFEFPHYYS